MFLMFRTILPTISLIPTNIHFFLVKCLLTLLNLDDEANLWQAVCVELTSVSKHLMEFLGINSNLFL